MRNILPLLVPLIAGVDIACFFVVFVMQRLGLSRSEMLGDWPENIGVAFVGVSVLALLAVAFLAGKDPVWRSEITRLQLTTGAVLIAYVLFVLVYLWRLLGGGI